MPIKTMAQALNEATEQLLRESDNRFLIGEGVPDPKGCFGSTIGLKEKFPNRVFDMPISENGMTGVCVGAAISGMRPMMVHMRADFLMYAMDQIVNEAAKIHFMYGGQLNCPLVIRAIVGRGWGQGCQHSQHLEKMFAMVPGLKVYYPYDAYTAKGLLIKAARGNNPVIFFEHRWLHETVAEVPDEIYECSDQPDVIIQGSYGSLAAHGYMVSICRKAIEFLNKQGIGVALIPYVKITSDYFREDIGEVKSHDPTPPAANLSKNHYRSVVDVMKLVKSTCDTKEAEEWENSRPHDIPYADFKGPF
jgi:pyruvate dehydrogenase E1 component beta subunit